MRTNGTLRYEIRSASQVNEYGEPIAAAVEWGEPIPCLIKANNDTRLGRYEDGEFRQASYTLLVECAESVTIERITLMRGDEMLGEYRVMSLTPMPEMGRTKIVV